jgi:hypothetical protein
MHTGPEKEAPEEIVSGEFKKEILRGYFTLIFILSLNFHFNSLIFSIFNLKNLI